MNKKITLVECVRTGIERFYNKYPEYPQVKIQDEYIGIGAMMVTPEILFYDNKKPVEKRDKMKCWCLDSCLSDPRWSGE